MKIQLLLLDFIRLAMSLTVRLFCVVFPMQVIELRFQSLSIDLSRLSFAYGMVRMSRSILPILRLEFQSEEQKQSHPTSYWSLY
jgi:hypothetical protein